jgi:hypothetical protein
MAGATVIGAGISYFGAKSAQKSQEKAARRAQDIQASQFAETKGMLSPFVSGGEPAFQKQQALSGALGAEAQQQAYAEFQEGPGVAFQRAQGMRGIEQGLAARGVGGGSRLKAISEYNQQLAMQDFSNQFNRLGAVTGVGLGAASALTGAGSSAAAGQASSIMAQGAASASGAISRAGAFSSGLQSLGNIYAANKMGLLK